jgi:hypothetical protein
MTHVVSRSGVTGGDSVPISKIDILWMTAGLGCDGDTIAVTVATHPSIEGLVLGAFPWIPKVNFHNPSLADENGDEFVQYLLDAAKASSDVAVITRSHLMAAAEFDEATAKHNIQGVRPGLEIFTLSARTGEEMVEFWSFSNTGAAVLAQLPLSENK